MLQFFYTAGFKCNSFQIHYPMIASDWDFARSDLRSAQVPSRSDRTLLVGESFARQLLQKISKPTMQSQMKVRKLFNVAYVQLYLSSCCCTAFVSNPTVCIGARRGVSDCMMHLGSHTAVSGL